MADFAKQTFWNTTAPLTDGTAVLPGTGIRAAQEVGFEKVIRKFMRADRLSWMELVLFSLVTQSTDAGAGAWYGQYKDSSTAGFMDVLKEFVRPLGSVILINYVFDVFKNGLRNPMKSFSFKDLLIRLSAKNLAEGGQAVMKQNIQATRQAIHAFEDLRDRQQLAARFRSSGSGSFWEGGKQKGYGKAMGDDAYGE